MQSLFNVIAKGKFWQHIFLKERKGGKKKEASILQHLNSPRTQVSLVIKSLDKVKLLMWSGRSLLVSRVTLTAAVNCGLFVLCVLCVWPFSYFPAGLWLYFGQSPKRGSTLSKLLSLRWFPSPVWRKGLK